MNFLKLYSNMFHSLADMDNFNGSFFTGSIYRNIADMFDVINLLTEIDW